MTTRYTLAAITLLLVPLTAACGGHSGLKDSGPAHQVGHTAPAPEKTTQTPAYTTPDASDFLFAVKTTRRQCFGSAGCNMTVEPVLTWVGEKDIDPGKTYQITYEIHGDESGPVIETLTLTDSDHITYRSSVLSTNGHAKISAQITDLEETS